MEQIHAYYKERFDISEKDWGIFSSKLIQQKFSKHEPILNEGQTENYLSFVESGIVRLYIPKLDNDLTFGFVFEGSFMSGYDSFITQSPSKYAVQAITDTILWRITYDDLQTVYVESEIGNLIGREASEEQFLIKSKRELSLLNNTAEERYLNLFTERPELLKKVPLKYIASYIGVTPQALSRIRKRIS
ncbi:Crp/Fnr family transcriptional regulator [Marinoscillum sp. MHG1-6]|uniref:Crp/Fnr family transcriptional regulator n=1 Tax=Marinoscillum sp. MHG1-6 TaxID=2959627 RepID=UPI0021587DA1|nr:Crp/Fnr family transcriptional regulator [Marinoscillum sp. MHG1-6]